MEDKWRSSTGSVSSHIVTLVFIIGVSYYAAFRLAGIFPERSLPFMISFTVFSSFCLYFQFAFRDSYKHSSLYRVLVWITGVFLSWLMYFGICILITDITCAVTRLVTGYPYSFGPFTAAAAAAALIFTLTGAAYARIIRTTRYKVTVNKKLEKPLRIVQLSDIHMGAVAGPRHLQMIKKKVNAAHPDLIVITGDLVNHTDINEFSDLDAASAAFRGMHSPLGIYSVMGNHDPELTDPDFIKFCHDSGIIPIDNKVITVGGCLLAGRTKLVSDAEKREPLIQILQDTEHEKLPVIVLDHDPKGIDEAVRCNADLVLCGHTHKGQFFPFSIFTRLVYSRHYFYGIAKHKNTVSIVSSGCGYFQTPVRIGTSSEIVCIIMRGQAPMVSKGICPQWFQGA